MNDTLLKCNAVPPGAGTKQRIFVLADTVFSPKNELYSYDKPVIDYIKTQKTGLQTGCDTRGGDVVLAYGRQYYDAFLIKLS